MNHNSVAGVGRQVHWALGDTPAVRAHSLPGAPIPNIPSIALHGAGGRNGAALHGELANLTELSVTTSVLLQQEDSPQLVPKEPHRPCLAQVH